MNKLPFYIITSDETSHILPSTAYLLNKYWGIDQKFKILGNNKPLKQLPDNFEFIKIKDNNNIENWSISIYEFLKNNENHDHIILTLDDYFPIRNINEKLYNNLLNLCVGNEKIGRVNLGQVNPNRSNQANMISSEEDYDLFFLKQDAPYRLTCQTSIWNREYLLSFLKNRYTPWQLELDGSSLSNNDGFEIAETFKSFSFDWIQESSLSGRYPGKINVLGLPTEDLKYLIENNFIDKSNVQFGMWNHLPVIQFNEIEFGFNFDFLKNKIDQYHYDELSCHYGYIYK